MKTLVISIVTLAFFAVSAVSAAQDRNQTLEDAVWAKLKSEKLDKQVAEVVVFGGSVTLRGKPSNVYMKMKVIEVALSVEGVDNVEDDLEVAAAESQEDMVKELRNQVLTYPHFTVFDDVGFQLQDEGLVVLTGYVTQAFKKSDLEERVAKVMGVRELNNVIEVLPVGDERLRRILFDRIYGNTLFVQYANRTYPPIRIIVKNGNVTLTGAVTNRVEKVQAENIARTTFGVINFESRLQISR